VSDLVTRLRASHRPGETITGDVAPYLEAADRIAALEMALVKLSQTNGSHSDGADANTLAIPVRIAARRALKAQPTDGKINEAFKRATRC
jgi:hypothetical protein